MRHRRARPPPRSRLRGHAGALARRPSPAPPLPRAGPRCRWRMPRGHARPAEATTPCPAPAGGNARRGVRRPVELGDRAVLVHGDEGLRQIVQVGAPIERVAPALAMEGYLWTAERTPIGRLEDSLRGASSLSISAMFQRTRLRPAPIGTLGLTQFTSCSPPSGSVNEKVSSEPMSRPPPRRPPPRP